MTIQQFGNAFKAKITNKDRKHTLGVIEGISNFFDNTHNYEEGQSSVIDDLWNGGKLTQANLRNKTGAGEYEDWRWGGPIDDTEAGELIGKIYNIGFNDVDFLIERENNDVRVINPLTSKAVGGTANIIALEDKFLLQWKVIISGEETSLWEKALTSTSTTAGDNLLMWSGFDRVEEEMNTSTNLTPTSVKALLDNEWEITDITNYNDGRLQATVSEKQTQIEQPPKKI